LKKKIYEPIGGGQPPHLHPFESATAEDGLALTTRKLYSPTANQQSKAGNNAKAESLYAYQMRDSDTKKMLFRQYHQQNFCCTFCNQRQTRDQNTGKPSYRCQQEM